MPQRIKTYNEFWPYYLKQHQNKTCRMFHYAGNLSLIILTLFALASQQFFILCLAPVSAYGLAWIGHFAFERNRPATFTYPLWSLWSDFRLISFLLSGKLAQEFRKHTGKSL